MKTDWKPGRIGDLCMLRQEQSRPNTNDETPYLSLEHVDSGAFFATRYGTAGKMLSTQNRFSPGDVLYGKLRPYLDKVVLADREGTCTTELLVLRPNREVVPLYLLSALHTQDFIQHAIQTTHGVNHPRTSWAAIREFELLIAPPNEQHRIAAVLGKVQRAVELEAGQERAARELKQAVMRQLFTCGLHNEPLRDTPLGPLPEGWGIVSARNAFKLTSGKTRPPQLVDSLSSSHPYPVVGGNGTMGYAAEWFVDRGVSLVIGRVGEYCGATHLVRGKVWITDNALYDDEWLDAEISKEFLGAFLQFFNLNRFKRLGGQPLITQGQIYDLSFPKPSPAEQREIAAILGVLDRKIAQHAARCRARQDLFRSALHALMTARLRVPEDLVP